MIEDYEVISSVVDDYDTHQICEFVEDTLIDKLESHFTIDEFGDAEAVDDEDAGLFINNIIQDLGRLITNVSPEMRANILDSVDSLLDDIEQSYKTLEN